MQEDLATELDALPADVLERLARHRFDRPRWLALAERLRRQGPPDQRVEGSVEPPLPGDVEDLPPAESREAAQLRVRGLEALRQGHCALLVLAGGMATRMGGAVKALVEALPGHTFLDLRLREVRHLTRTRGASVPLWLMTSLATDAALCGALGGALGADLDGERLATFRQNLSLRFTEAGRLFRDEAGLPSEHASGHGDLPDALRASGLLERFLDRGGRYVMVANLDNLGASIDPLLVGYHLEHGGPVTCEVVDKLGGDRGGIPVRHRGRRVVLEEFRLPESLDAATVPVFNTNTFHFDARALHTASFDWTYFVVQKLVDGRPALQMERLLGEVTSHLETRLVRVPRVGHESRFLPVKDAAELERRGPELEAMARARGLFS